MYIESVRVILQERFNLDIVDSGNTFSTIKKDETVQPTDRKYDNVELTRLIVRSLKTLLLTVTMHILAHIMIAINKDANNINCVCEYNDKVN